MTLANTTFRSASAVIVSVDQTLERVEESSKFILRLEVNLSLTWNQTGFWVRTLIVPTVCEVVSQFLDLSGLVWPTSFCPLEIMGPFHGISSYQFYNQEWCCRVNSISLGIPHYLQSNSCCLFKKYISFVMIICLWQVWQAYNKQVLDRSGKQYNILHALLNKMIIYVPHKCICLMFLHASFTSSCSIHSLLLDTAAFVHCSGSPMSTQPRSR